MSDSALDIFNQSARGMADILDRKATVARVMDGKADLKLDADACSSISFMLRNYADATESLRNSVKTLQDTVASQQAAIAQCEKITKTLDGAKLLDVLAIWLALRSKVRDKGRSDPAR
jgi:hypothetical protein